MSKKLNEKIIRRDIEVELVDSMGNDFDIEKAARISYNRFKNEGEFRPAEKTINLVRRLFWHRHTSPFEMVEFKFFVEIPIFVARQIIRHRTASVNELSRRYTSSNIEFFNFELRYEDKSITNQGSGDAVNSEFYYNSVESVERKALETYNMLVSEGIANETARVVLPHTLMTAWVWKIDLHNLLHFLNLRDDSHAQKETRKVAQRCLELIEPVVPITVAAYKDWKKLMSIFMKVGYNYYKGGKVEELAEFLESVEIFDND